MTAGTRPGRGRGRADGEPQASATVVLARQGRAAVEFLLVRRQAGGVFGASDVFPGGVVEAQDRAARHYCKGISEALARRRLGLAEGALDYHSAAIRELFEETGVLLARAADGRMPPGIPALDAATLDDVRRRLASGGIGWPAMLERHGLTLAAEALTYVAWWITPLGRSRRFSTRFFVATLPDGQSARHDGVELTDSRWLAAADALAAGRRGELSLPPPTAATLRELAALPALDELRRWGAARERAGVPAILPVIVADGGGERILLPGGDGDDSAPGGEGGS